jgi:GNAT superfamily N-acetyltransferase
MKGIEFRAISDLARVADAAHLFVDNVDLSYISHGEIMDGRAAGLGNWSLALIDIITSDFEEAILNAHDSLADGLHLVGAFKGKLLEGLALYEYIAGRRGRYAVIHDFLVSKDMRRKSLGSSMLMWLERQFREAKNIKHVFLESGKTNEPAHNFFHHHGYRQCSITMIKEIDLPIE